MEAETTPTHESRRRRPWLPAAAGLALSPIGFAFGPFAALPGLAAVVPGLRRLMPFSFALLGGVAACWLLSLAGVNPWLSLVKSRVVAQLETATGAEVTFEAWRGNALRGELSLDNVHIRLPEGVGEISLRSVRLKDGYGFLLPPKRSRVYGENFEAVLDPASGLLENYLSREVARHKDLLIQLETGRINLVGSGVSGTFEVDSLLASLGRDHRILDIIPRSATLRAGTVEHPVKLSGYMRADFDHDGLRVAMDLSFFEGEGLHGALQGSLRPGGESDLVCTVDYALLEPLWGRHRTADTLHGETRGRILIRGEFSRLEFDFGFELHNVKYEHRHARLLRGAHAPSLSNARLSGTLILMDGQHVTLRDVTLRAEQATFSTSEALAAHGPATLRLEGEPGAFRGELTGAVAAGVISRPISWSPLPTTSLDDLRPNTLRLLEAFPGLQLAYALDVENLRVSCAPVFGTAQGRLHGTITRPGRGPTAVSMGGHLELTQGRIRFLAAEGSCSLRLDFNPHLPARHSSLRGGINGAVGDAPLIIEVSGALQRPALVFRGLTMPPEEMGRKIYKYSPTPLTPEQQQARRNALAFLCGPTAALQGNPFLANQTGRVFISVQP